MIAEVLLVLAGHDSSLFQGTSIHPAFVPLLHPGEQQILESLANLASRYRRIRSFCSVSLNSDNRYICTLCSTLNAILRDEYEALVIETEARILRRDNAFVASGSFVPISSVLATFAQWDAPLKSLQLLVDRLQESSEWEPGPLIDLLLQRANTGIASVSSIFSRISIAVQQLWMADLSAFLLHGAVSKTYPLASQGPSPSSSPASSYVLRPSAIPSCVSPQAKESIIYVGRAVATVQAARNLSKQFPRSMAIQHANLLDGVFPHDRHSFEHAISEVRSDVSEWLWLNVLTREAVEDAVESLSNYFLMRNGEFGLSLIREIEGLKLSRLTLNPLSRQSQMIREQDLHLAMLRASLGTSAQNDPTLTRLRFVMPSGPLRPLLPSLQHTSNSDPLRQTDFDDMLLGTTLKLTYSLSWPLDLFLTPSALASYNSLFAFLSTVRKTHVRVLDSWVSLSNAQRARRRWTGTSEGGTDEDRGTRERLLRCAWGSARTMNWFLEAVMEYIWYDVIEEEYVKLKMQLKGTQSKGTRLNNDKLADDLAEGQDTDASARKNALDFNTLRVIHTVYLNNLLNNTLVSHPMLSASLRLIFETCEIFVAQTERWGGDVLPALLFEGSISDAAGTRVGHMVSDRLAVVREINEKLNNLLHTFYEQLSLMISQPFAVGADSSTRSFVMNTTATTSLYSHQKGAKNNDAFGSVAASDTRRHVERLLLRLDFGGGFSNPPSSMIVEDTGTNDILREGGLA